MKQLRLFTYLFVLSFGAEAQDSLDLRGLFSAVGSYSPDNRMDMFIGARYIPELIYMHPIDSTFNIDFEASLFMSASALFHPGDTFSGQTNISPYRLWGRFSSKQFELRIGLQKIDFGSAAIIRPLQWFNRIDPRDPLQLTNGVYGALARYYFLNNANIWLWGLYGNKDPRGFDVLGSNPEIPEMGGRIQLPVNRGEIGLTYHHRTAQSKNNPLVMDMDIIPENKWGLDGKFDLLVGAWFEMSYSRKSREIGILTHQTMANIGTDYTFGLGNGLNVIAEHLIASFDSKAFAYSNPVQVSGLTLSYPLSFFDNLSMIFYQSWASNDLTFFLNYEHRFRYFSSYLMAYYNPATQQGVQQNELVNNFSGPGIRVMLVYNH